MEAATAAAAPSAPSAPSAPTAAAAAAAALLADWELLAVTARRVRLTALLLCRMRTSRLLGSESESTAPPALLPKRDPLLPLQTLPMSIPGSAPPVVDVAREAASGSEAVTASAPAPACATANGASPLLLPLRLPALLLASLPSLSSFTLSSSTLTRSALMFLLAKLRSDANLDAALGGVEASGSGAAGAAALAISESPADRLGDCRDKQSAGEALAGEPAPS